MENPLELDQKPSELSYGQRSADNIEATLAIPETVIATEVRPLLWVHRTHQQKQTCSGRVSIDTIFGILSMGVSNCRHGI